MKETKEELLAQVAELRKRNRQLNNQLQRSQRILTNYADNVGAYWIQIGDDPPVVCCAKSVRYACISAARRAEDRGEPYAAVFLRSTAGLTRVAERTERGQRRWREVVSEVVKPTPESEGPVES